MSTTSNRNYPKPIKGNNLSVDVDRLGDALVEIDADVQSLVGATASITPSESPSFSGVPTAPTAASGNSTQQIANTQFVQNSLAGFAGLAPEVLNSIEELATALGNDPNYATTITTQLSLKVNTADFNSAIAAANASVGAKAGKYNLIINGDFPVNQRDAATKAQSVGVYGYDRWKGHADGLEQVIESLPADEYTLTWSGGGNGTFGGTTAVSPIKATVIAGNTSVIVPATATRVSLVEGDATGEADPFTYRSDGEELWLCQRYFNLVDLKASGGLAYKEGTGVGAMFNSSQTLPNTMRAIPTVSQPTGSIIYTSCSGISYIASEVSLSTRVTSTTAGAHFRAYNTTGDFLHLDSEL